VNDNKSIKNLIFDLGGVILDLSVDQTMQQFSTLSGLDKQKVNDLYTSTPGFEAYERGLMSDNDFRDFVRKVFSVQSSDEEIDACWNAMLLGLPVRKLNLLQNLKKNYSVYLLSNTNNIHLNHINQIMLPGVTHPGNSLDTYFHRAYYSHVMKKRKPNADIFDQVLTENSLLAHETLFLDDNLSNIEGAKLLGIQTVHVLTPDLILNYFHEQ
jgi:FMN phosphatase YigB (HAD superfamily)